MLLEPAQSINVAVVPLRVPEEPSLASIAIKKFGAAKVTQEDGGVCKESNSDDDARCGTIRP